MFSAEETIKKQKIEKKAFSMTLLHFMR